MMVIPGQRRVGRGVPVEWPPLLKCVRVACALDIGNRVVHRVWMYARGFSQYEDPPL